MTAQPPIDHTDPLDPAALEARLKSTADEFEIILSPQTEQTLDAHLVDQCDFLNRTFKKFTNHIDNQKHSHLPTTSYEYAFKAMSHFRASYTILHTVNARRKKMEKREEK